MSVTVECSHCQAPLKLKDRSKLGKKIACPKCGKPFVLKAASEDSDDAGDEFETTPVHSTPPRGRRPSAKLAARPSAPSSSGGGKAGLIAGAGLLVAVLVGVGLFAAGVFSRGAPDPQVAAGGTAPIKAVPAASPLPESSPAASPAESATALPSANDPRERLVEQRCRKLLDAIASDLATGQKEMTEVWTSEAQTRSAFGELGADVYESVVQLQRDMPAQMAESSIVQNLRGATASLKVRDLRVAKDLTPAEAALVGLVPAKFGIYDVLISMKDEEGSFFPFIVFDDNDVRAVPPLRLLEARLEGKIKIAQAGPAASSTPSASLPTVEAKESKTALIEKSTRKVFEDVASGDVAIARKTMTEMWVTEEQMTLLLGDLAKPAFDSVREFQQLGLKNLERGREESREILKSAEFKITDLRTKKDLSREQEALVALVPSKYPLFDVTITVDGRTEPYFPAVVFENNVVRAIPPLPELVTKLEGKLKVAQATGGPAAPLSATGESLLGKKAGELREDNGLKMKFVWCPPGKFPMGLPKNQRVVINPDNEDAVQVELTAGFWIGQMEVTEGEWKDLMQSDAPGSMGRDFPVSSIKWVQADEFCRKLTAQERAAGRLPEGWEYSLPTESQWEYACRAGTTSAFFFGSVPKQLEEYGWYRGNSSVEGSPQKHPVAKKKPNAWGLYDTLGNLSEYCLDWYQDHVAGGKDPRGPARGETRILKGGHWVMDAIDCRCSGRYAVDPEDGIEIYGFRVAIVRSADGAK